MVGVSVAGVVSMKVLIVFGDAMAGLVIRLSISSSAVVNPVVSAAMDGDKVGKENSEVQAAAGD